MASNQELGQLDQKVTLQSRSNSVDAVGQSTITWTDIATVWAGLVSRPRSREFDAAGGTQNEQTVTFRVVYRTDVDATCRLVWEGRNHDVIAADPVKRDGWLYITCLQGVKDGR